MTLRNGRFKSSYSEENTIFGENIPRQEMRLSYFKNFSQHEKNTRKHEETAVKYEESTSNKELQKSRLSLLER